jgi:hypothetical protein
MRGSPKKRTGLGQRALNLFCATVLAMTMVQWPVMSAYAANFSYTGGADFGPAYVLNDHSTVYKVHVTATSGLTPGKTYYVIARLTDGLGGGFNNNARGYNWSPALNQWAQVRGAANQFPAVVADASGAASATVYFKVGDENFTGFAAANGHATGQAYLAGSFSDGTNNGNPSTGPIVDVLSAKAQGAWIHNGIATGASGNVTATAGSDTNLTEANLIDDDANGVVDDEDFGPTGATGDFRLGVAAGSTVGVTLGDTPWAPGQGVVAGPADTDIAVGAPDMVPPAAPASLASKGFNGSVVLDWAASTDSGGSGLAGYRVYRTVGTQDASAGTGAGNTSALPVLIATVGAGTITYTDTTVANGTLYQYWVRAIDADTNVSARSNTCVVTPLADTTAPTSTLSGVAEGGVYGDPATFSLAADDGTGSGVSGSYYRLDSDVATQTYTAPVAVSGTGPHSVTYWATDAAGNTEVPRTMDFTIASNLPRTTVDGIPAGWSTTPVTFSLSATGVAAPLSTFYALGDAEAMSYTAPVTVSTEGTTTLSYFSRNSLGDTEATRTATILVDSTVPTWSPSGMFSMTGFDNHLTSQILVTLDWSGAVDGISGVSRFRVWMTNGTTGESSVVATVPVGSYEAGGNTWQGQASEVLPTVWTGTTYYFKVQAGDAAGNWSTTYNLLGGSKTETDTVKQGFAAYDGSNAGPALPPKWGDSDFLRATNVGTESTPSVMLHWSTPTFGVSAPDPWFYSVKADYCTPPVDWIDAVGPTDNDQFRFGAINSFLWDGANPNFGKVIDGHTGYTDGFDPHPHADTQYYFNIHAYAWNSNPDLAVHTTDNVGSDGPIVPVNTSWSNSPLPGTTEASMNVALPANELKFVQSTGTSNKILYGNVVSDVVDPNNAFFAIGSSGNASYPVIAAGGTLATACVELTNKATGENVALPADPDGLAAFQDSAWPVAAPGTWTSAKGTFYGYRWAAKDGTGDTARLEIHLPKLESNATYVLTLKSPFTARFNSADYSYEFTTGRSTSIALGRGSSTLPSYGAACSITGTLTAAGAGLANQRLVVQSSSDNRTFVDTSVTATTTAGGAFSVSVKPSTRTYYRFRFAATGSYMGVTGSSIAVTPVARVSNPVAPSTMYHHSYRTIYGYLWPRHTAGTAAVRIYKYRYVAGAWRSYGYELAKVANHSSYSEYAHSMRLQYSGKWRLRAYAPADSGHAAAWSSGYEYVTVR